MEKNSVDCNKESRTQIYEPKTAEIEKLWVRKGEVDRKEDSVQEFDENQIIIVDNLVNAKEFRSSVEIERQLKAKSIEGAQYIYSLPKGGVALQFKQKELAEKALND